MKFKLTFRNVMLAVSVLIVILIALILAVIGIAGRKPAALFYGLPERSRSAIEGELMKVRIKNDTKKAPFEIRTQDDSVPLERVLRERRRPDILFIRSGRSADLAVKYAEKKTSGFPSGILNGMTTSVKKAAGGAKKITGVPILIDNYEIDVSRSALRACGMKEIASWADIETVAAAVKTSAAVPVAIPAGDDKSLIDIIGAVTESLSGAETWEQAKDRLAAAVSEGRTTQNDFYDLLGEMTKEGGEFYETAEMLARWQEAGILTRNVFQMTMRDITACMGEDLCAVVFMTLSEHRSVSHNVITRYISTYYPFHGQNTRRRFTSPVILAVPLSNDKAALSAVRQLAAARQDALSGASGLAPVQAAAAVPDRQADDVRYWVASTDEPLPALSDAVFTDSGTRAACAEAMRTAFRR